MSRSLVLPSRMPSIADCRWLDLPKINDPRGNLTFLEGNEQVPFEIRRVFYLYDVPEGGVRAGHALRTCDQLVIAVAGSFDLVLRDGESTRRVSLDDPARAFHIAPMIWRELVNFSAGAVCLVLAAERYAEAGYLRTYAEYLAARSEE